MDRKRKARITINIDTKLMSNDKENNIILILWCNG